MARLPPVAIGTTGRLVTPGSGDTLGAAVVNHVTNPAASPYPAQNYDDVWVSTASAAQAIILPSVPTPNMLVGAMRLGAYPLTVQANGKAIAGTVADLIINRDQAGVWLLWDATLSSWQVQSRRHA